MIYLVLGMHKSGTTLIARTLHESGIMMGQEFPAGAEYKKTKYEAGWIQQINDAILGADRQVLSSTVTSSMLPKEGPPEEIYNLMRGGISQQQKKYGDWGFKDPRAVLTYPHWKNVLPPHKLIVTYRNPIEVWKRYFRKDRFWQLQRPFEAWADYNSLILNYVSESANDDVCIIEFERLLADDTEMQRLEKFTGCALVDARDPAQSQNRLSQSNSTPCFLKIMEQTLGRESNRIYQSLNSAYAANAGEPDS